MGPISGGPMGMQELFRRNARIAAARQNMNTALKAWFVWTGRAPTSGRFSGTTIISQSTESGRPPSLQFHGHT
jgi:hypothetical protein